MPQETTKILDYLVSVSAELAQLAMAADQPVMAHLYKMATLEAEQKLAAVPNYQPPAHGLWEPLSTRR